MFEMLEDVITRQKEIVGELAMPETAGDPKKLQKLMKEQADIAPAEEKEQKTQSACARNSEIRSRILISKDFATACCIIRRNKNERDHINQ